jgi:quinol monooxygenase YgiN
MTKTLYAEFIAKPGCEERIRELLSELTALVVEEEGNIAFVPYTLEQNPRRFFVFEVYVDDEAFNAHIAADYGIHFNRALADLIEGSGSELTWLTPLDAARATTGLRQPF